MATLKGYVVDALPKRGSLRVFLDGFREVSVRTTFPVYVKVEDPERLYEHPAVKEVHEEDWSSFEGRLKLCRVELEDLGALNYFRRKLPIYNLLPSPISQALFRLNMPPLRLIEVGWNGAELLQPLNSLEFPEVSWVEVKRYDWFGPYRSGRFYRLCRNGTIERDEEGEPEAVGDLAYCDGRCPRVKATFKVEGGAERVWLPGLKGLMERSLASRSLPREIAYSSIGKSLTINEAWVAMERRFAVPELKVNVEDGKTLSQLMDDDKAGLMFFPRPGIYDNAYQLDFVSMYPSIIVSRNISPELIQEAATAAGGIELSSSRNELGIVPEAIRRLIERREALKAVDRERADAVKLMLVASFGYLGYRNSKFGRVEAYEQVTKEARKAMRVAVEVAEGWGFSIIHGIIDSLMVQGPEERLDDMLADVMSATRLKVRVDEIFDWVAFTFNEQGEPHPQRYFGRTRGGGLKARGMLRSNQPNLVKWFLAEVMQRAVQEMTGVRAKRAVLDILPSLEEKYVSLSRSSSPLAFVMEIKGTPYIRGRSGFYEAIRYVDHDPDYYAAWVIRVSRELRRWFS